MRYRTTDYDWRQCEKKLNALPQSPPGRSRNCFRKRSALDPAATDTNAVVRSFQVDIPKEAIVDLQRRITARRPPEREPSSRDSS
jgi:hypothetical protein